MKRIRVKPGRPQSIMGFIFGLVFCCIGFFVVIPTFGIFGIFWTLISVIVTIASAVNAFGKKGFASHEIIIDDDSPEDAAPASPAEPDSPGATAADTKKRLDSLKELYSAGIITKQEYDQRRADIIADATK